MYYLIVACVFLIAIALVVGFGFYFFYDGQDGPNNHNHIMDGEQ